MRYHILLSKPCNFRVIEADIAAGKRPAHLTLTLTRALNAIVHEPRDESASLADKVRSKLISWSPGDWALARKLARELNGDDVVYCQGDEGLALAAMCSGKEDPPTIVIWVHNIDRPRARIALKYFGYAKHIALWITNTPNQERLLLDYLSIPRERVYWDGDQTDVRFFTPGPSVANKARPVIACVGLEHRDFRTLAEATEDLDVDVRITAFSRHATQEKKMFPTTLPKNMSAKYYSWLELLQLYRDADVVVISLFENKFCAGMTTFLEALSCKRPVVVTRTHGLGVHLANPGIARIVPVGDAMAMRVAIQELLRDKGEAERMAERGHEMVVNHHNHDQKAQRLVALLLMASGMQVGEAPLQDSRSPASEFPPL